jgi:hypothetical protein
MLNLRSTSALSIFDRLIPDKLSHTATSFVESLKINSLNERTRRGRRVVVKSRNLYGERAADLINFYFRLAGTGIRYVSKVREWQHWETKCFNMLNGDKFEARIVDAHTIELAKLPGKSLWDHMNDGTLTPRMLRAAGREYRRAHAMHMPQLRGGWSHGDASMPNVIYDERSDRARLIDFEMMHEKSWSQKARHADDLLVFLLDMVGRVSSRHWLPFALAFLRAYDDVDLMREVRKRLVIPTGMALIWWNVRTNFAKRVKIDRRFKSLRRALKQVELYSSVARARRPNKRLPSTNCQRRRPGMPTPSSRMRATRDRAKAASPGIPRKLPTKT